MSHKALLIGLEKNPAMVRNDILSLTQALLTTGVDYQLSVINGIDAAKEKIKERLKYFFDAEREDVLVVYIAAEGGGLSFSVLENLLRETEAMSATIFIDCISGEKSKGLFLIEAGDGKAIIGCKREAKDDNLFAWHLTQAFRGAAGQNWEVTPANLYSYLSKNMSVRAEFSNQAGKKKRLLYLHTMDREYGSIAYKSLFRNLEETYDCVVRYGISKDSSKLGFAPLEFVLSDIDIIIIEKTIGYFKVGDSRTDRFEPQVIYEFIQRGGLVLFLQAELSSALNDYNRILAEMSLPTIYTTNSISEFSGDYEAWEKNLFNSMIVGHTKNSDKKSAPLFTSGDKFLIPPDLNKAFSGLQKLAAINPIHLADNFKRILSLKDEGILMKGYPFDSKTWIGGEYLGFGSCSDTQIGNGILLTGDICNDELIEEYASDAVRFVTDLIAMFLDYPLEPLG